MNTIDTSDTIGTIDIIGIVDMNDTIDIIDTIMQIATIDTIDTRHAIHAWTPRANGMIHIFDIIGYIAHITRVGHLACLGHQHEVHQSENSGKIDPITSTEPT